MVVMSLLPGAAGLLTSLGRTEGYQPVRGNASQGHTKDRVPALRAHEVQTAKEPRATGWPCGARWRHVCHPLVPRMLFQTEPESILTAVRLDRGQRQRLLQTGSSGESHALCRVTLLVAADGRVLVAGSSGAPGAHTTLSIPSQQVLLGNRAYSVDAGHFIVYQALHLQPS